MVLEKKALKELDKLLEMSKENFVEMLERWQDLQKNSLYQIKDIEQFKIGYVFGKIEHKFIAWFYTEFGRSQTDEEYDEFMNIVKSNFPKNTNNYQFREEIPINDNLLYRLNSKSLKFHI